MDTDLDQIQEDWAGRNFMTISSVNPLIAYHKGMQRWITNLQLSWIQLSIYEFINGIWGAESGGVVGGSLIRHKQ